MISPRKDNSVPASYFLVGPTAVGKSSVAQFLAHEHDYNVLSADSMLIYRGMDIGTATPSPEERGSVPYYGINIVDPSEGFSVWDYIEYVKSMNLDYSNCIVAGGTGLYVQALLEGLESVPGADLDLRKELEDQLENEGIQVLQEKLRSRAPELYESLKDKDNPRRIIRAIEISEGGVVERNENWGSNLTKIPGLSMDRDVLHERIKRRIDRMFEDGLMDEVEALMNAEVSLGETALQAIGYKEAISMLKGECGFDEAKELIAARTRKLAKRQMTWFRNRMNVDWIEVGPGMEEADVAGLVLDYWSTNGPAEIRLV
ncbi:tRNA (adenosine(37)-N6)-dimethylallyltransferase MiaA [bacterium E08(2017)]|nr:tRNA (adenosine(37)-N6)-dimethylallyltransferase MiaA [bacterium E08(2017)]